MTTSAAKLTQTIESISMRLPSSRRATLIMSIFESLDDEDKMECFNAMADRISVFDVSEEVITEALEDPTVKAPTVKAPTVKAPTVEAPTVEAPTVEAPTVKANTVEAPTVEAPTVEAPVEVEDKASESSYTSIVKRNVSKTSAPKPTVVKSVAKKKTKNENGAIVANSIDEANKLIDSGKAFCGYGRKCTKLNCQWIHPGDFLCMNYGNCDCELAHFKDMHTVKSYHRDTKLIVDNQADFDDMVNNGKKLHCSGGEHCYRNCTFLHIAKGYQCGSDCTDFACELVHVGNCRYGTNCNGWKDGKCGLDHYTE
jgi:hypothetical protein